MVFQVVNGSAWTLWGFLGLESMVKITLVSSEIGEKEVLWQWTVDGKWLGQV